MLWKIHQFIHFFATNHWNPDKKQCNRKNFLPYIWFFFLRKAKNTVFWAKTVFEGWLAPTLFLVLSLVSTVCGFGRKILHKMTDISSLISKLWHSDSPVSNSLSRTIRRTVRHHCCHHIAGRILQLLKLSSIYRCRRCHSSNFRSICRSNPCDIYLWNHCRSNRRIFYRHP